MYKFHGYRNYTALPVERSFPLNDSLNTLRQSGINKCQLCG